MVNMTEVCEENRVLVYAVMKQYHAACGQDRAVDLEDPAQAGYVRLIEAAQTYDETKRMFSTWAAIYIRMEMRVILGLKRRDPRVERNDISIDVEIWPDITMTDTLEAPDGTEEAVERSEPIRIVWDTGDALPAPQNGLVRLHDLLEQNLKPPGAVG